jgi:hypothetical protein
MTLDEKGASTNSITQSVQSKYPARRHPPLVELQWQNQADAQGSQNAVNQSTGIQHATDQQRQSIGSHTRRCSVDDQSAANQNRKSFISQTTGTGNASTAVRAQAISTQSISRDNKSIGSHTRRRSVDDESAANQNKKPFTPLARDRLSQHNNYYLVTAQTITTQTITACARTIRPCERQKHAAIRSICTRRRRESFFIHLHPPSVSRAQ